MVSEKKKKVVKEIRDELKNYSTIGLLDMHKMPARQLHEIRNKLRESAKIKMIKKRLIKLVFKNSGMNGIEKLIEQAQGEPALLLSKINPFKLARMIESNKSKASASAGDIAPKDIIVPAGPTPIMAGPAIGELQKIGLKVMVQDGKIAVNEDSTVAKEGDEITAEVADVLTKLEMKPMEIGLNLVCAWEDGMVYDKNIMFTPIEEYVADIKASAVNALNLSVNINYPTPENIRMLISKAHSESKSLSLEANILTSETIGDVLAKASAQAKALEELK